METARSRARLAFSIPYPFSERKESTSGRGDTAGLGKNSAKKTGDLLADRAFYIEGKTGICPVACEKNSSCFAFLILGEKAKASCCSQKLYSVSGFMGIC